MTSRIMMFSRPRKFKHLKKNQYLLLAFMLIGLTACSNPFSIESQIDSFNKSYAPEYYLTKTHLQVNWADNPQQDIAPLKLKIPVAYLSRAMNEKNEFETVTWALKPMKNGKIDTIYLALRRSNGQPVPYFYQKKSDSSELKKKKSEYFMDMYVVTIDRKLTIVPLFNKKSSVSFMNDKLFRGKDQAGLEHYVEMRCYDVQYLQTRARDFKGQDDSQNILKKLANKKSSDITPANCLPDFSTEYWISPANVPDDKAVRIYMDVTSIYKISFLYKNHQIVLSPIVSPQDTIENWQYYQQQVTRALDSFLIQ